MFEKLAEDIIYRMQVKLAALADQMEKTAKGYGHKLRRHQALTKKLEGLDINSQEAADVMNNLESNARNIARAHIRGEERAAKPTFNTVKPETDTWFRRNIGKYFGYGPEQAQVGSGNIGQEIQNARALQQAGINPRDNIIYGPLGNLARSTGTIQKQNPINGKTYNTVSSRDTGMYLDEEQERAATRIKANENGGRLKAKFVTGTPRSYYDSYRWNTNTTSDDKAMRRRGYDAPGEEVINKVNKIYNSRMKDAPSTDRLVDLDYYFHERNPFTGKVDIYQGPYVKSRMWDYANPERNPEFLNMNNKITNPYED